MVEITLFEIHFDDTTFDAQATANAPLGGLLGDDEGTDDDADESTAEAEASTDAGIGLGKLLLGVVLLGALAALAARLFSREDVDELVDAAGEEIELETETAEREADD
jgi:Pyruvate/2-oxoacid:ferredoxin oxidoreductase gamma subunit